MHDLGIYKRLTPVAPGARFFSKTCTRCNEVKPLDQFHRHRRGALGREADCIECAKSGARRGIDPRTVEKETAETLAIIQSKFALDASGQVIYKANGGSRARAGAVAGWLTPTGYRVVDVTLASGRPRNFQAHRIAFALANGRWPAPGEQVDHIDHRTESTDPSRLREVSAQVNRHNQFTPTAANTSGIRGVGWDRAAGKWRAQISVDGKTRYLGLFTDKVDAGLAYAAAKLKHQTDVPLATVCRIELAAFGARHDDLNDEEVDELAALARLMYIW